MYHAAMKVALVVVCPNCMHTACNSAYFGRAAAVRTKRKKKKYADSKGSFSLSSVCWWSWFILGAMIAHAPQVYSPHPAPESR